MASTFKCFPPKNSPDAFLAEGFAVVSIKPNLLRFQQFDGYSGQPTPMRDYIYSFNRIKNGNSKVAGMMEFVLKKEVKSYGDSIYSLYVDQALASGRNGALIFSGHGYSWDWNFCKRQ